MPIKKEKTKRGVFHAEFGSFNNKADPKLESLEDYYRRITPRSKKAEETFNMFIEYHLNNGYKRNELRLDRTAIEFGRRKS
jgi:hypothetical protein